MSGSLPLRVSNWELNLVNLGFGFTRCIALGIISVIIKIGTLLGRLPYSPEVYLFGA